MEDAALPARLRTVAVAVAVALLGLGVGLALVVAVSLGAAVGGVELPLVWALVLSLVLMQGVAFGGVALGYLALRGRSLSWVGVRLPSFRDALVVVTGYALALVAAIAGAAAVALTGVQAGRNQVADVALESPDVLLLLIPASFLLVGPGEELLFRGVVQRRLRETFGPVSGVVLASVVFAGVHFVALTGGVGARAVSIGILLFPSLVFGTVYELTDNLVVPALVHGGYNATLFSILYLSLRLAGASP